MPTSNGIISRPVAISDVMRTLGVYSPSLAYLCSNLHGRTNIWARFKPEATGSVQSLSLSRRRENNFGLSAAATYTSLRDFVSAVASGSFVPGWLYTPPDPLSRQPCRLGDWAGYDHYATTPFGSLSPDFFLLSDSISDSLSYWADSPDTSDSDHDDTSTSLAMSDFQSGAARYADWFFGILLLRDSSLWFAATTILPMGQSPDWGVDFGHIAPVYAGSYRAVPFLSSASFNTNSPDYSEPPSLRIVGTGQDAVSARLMTLLQFYSPSVVCLYTSPSSNSVEWTVSLSNPGASERTLRTVAIEMATDDSGSGSTTLTLFSQVQIPAAGSWTRSGTSHLGYAGSGPADYRWYRLVFTGGQTPWILMEDTDDREDYA